MKILQINCNRSYPAHDLALATAREMGVGIVVLCEPNRKAIENRNDWTYDDGMDTAIKVTDPRIVIRGQGKGNGFSYIITASFTIYGCYASPNKQVEELEETLEQIETIMRSRNEESLIVGDFNAKSPQWGMNMTDKRGQILTEWISQHDLYVKNVGKMPTFQRREYGSILDLTLASEKISKKIANWEVSEKESLSDHNYVVFEVLETLVKKRKQPRRGWNSRKIDEERQQKAIQEILVTPESETAQGFSKTLKRVCNECMPKARRFEKGQPMYWWNDKIAELRRVCHQNRRKVTRIARKNHPVLKRILWQEYDRSKKELRRNIKVAKKGGWDQVLEEVDRDIWGKGYEIVMRKTIGQAPKPQLSMQMVEDIVKQLFPVHEAVNFKRVENTVFSCFTIEELKLASSKLKKKKAPGPGNIPPEIVKQVALSRPEYVLQVYNKLAASGKFPKEWKTANLVLLRKGNKPVESPSSYRPICLLDVEGKLYEQLILHRLKKELDRTGGLAENQFGFREGRQTVDAIMRVVVAAEHAASFSKQCRRLCAVIAIDVKNAFNSASWQNILDELRRRGIDEGLINLIASYLSERKIWMEAEGISKTKEINSGVPQGSVLGPTLWNVQYDGLLKLELPEGVELVGFADDIAMVVEAENSQTLMNRANLAIRRVVQWMTKMKLQLAPEKTEAVLLTTKRKVGHVQFDIQGTAIRPGKALKQLGVWIDTKLNFNEHLDKTVQKAERTMTALAGLMPNIGGPRASKRRVLTSVVHSQILYAAPIWGKAMQRKEQRKKLARIQKIMGIRVCSGYRTVSTEGVRVLAGIAPIELLAKERQEIYEGRPRDEARTNLMARWQEMWDAAKTGRWTWRLIPDIRKWLERPYGEMDYFLTQALSGHGCFRKYLFDRKRSTTDKCPYCGELDDACHTLFSCTKWEEVRQEFQRETGKLFTDRSMMASLIESEKGWLQAYRVIRHIVQNKEQEGRQLCN